MYLLFADILVVGAALAVHFFSPQTLESTLFVIGAVVAGGLFLFVPLLLELLQERGSAVSAVDVLRNDIADNQRVLQDDIRVFAESCLKRFSALEKSAAQEEGGAGRAVALAEVEERLRGLLDDVQAQLDGVADAVHGFQRAVEVHAAAVEKQAVRAAPDEGDGPLPPSLMAKALASGGAAGGGAVARLIGNAAPVAPHVPRQGEGVAEEDEVWTSASDMANREVLEEGAEVPVHSLFPKTAPVPDDESQGTLSLTPEPVSSGAEPVDADEVSDADAPAADEAGDDATLPSDDDAGEELVPVDEEPAPVRSNEDLLLELGLPPEPLRELPRATPSARAANTPVTTLIANVLVGFGNRPYVRGNGPGLSEDIGVPMERVEAGCWRWMTPDASRLVRVTLWKNDIHKFAGDPVEIAVGTTVEIDPVFPGD